MFINLYSTSFFSLLLTHSLFIHSFLFTYSLLNFFSFFSRRRLLMIWLDDWISIITTNRTELIHTWTTHTFIIINSLLKLTFFIFSIVFFSLSLHFPKIWCCQKFRENEEREKINDNDWYSTTTQKCISDHNLREREKKRWWKDGSHRKK